MMSALSITFSYHRTWLIGALSYLNGLNIHLLFCPFRASGRDNVMDLKQQWFYRFLRNTICLHIMTFWTLVYLWGGLPYLTCGVGVGGTITYHGTGIVNSACHIWGSRAWNTKDTSRNIWWLGPFTMGESWHNNHHAFETSARYGLEWYQALGLATDVKLPSEAQKRKLAFAHPIDRVSTHRYHHQFTDSDRDQCLWEKDKCGILKEAMGIGGSNGASCDLCINSLCHIWGSRTWKTNDTSCNVWYFLMGDATKEDVSGSSRKVVGKKRRAYFFRKWTKIDVMRASSVGTVHFLCLLAPFYFKWEALLFGVILAFLTSLCITFSYHRNLAHRSFKLPKWLEYSFAYFALFALQGHPIDWVSTHRFHHQFTDSDRDPHSPMEGFWFSHVFWIFDTNYIREKCGGRDNVMDLKQQWFYRFLRNTVGLHIMTFWTLVYLWGGLPYLTCGIGAGGAIGYNGTWLINSACHIWGSRAWNTKDTSRNIWWLGPFTMGESWHNNHHAFEASARHGLEWYQALGLATDVKLPSEAQKRKLAFP
ncbi:hypothetical protein HID58_091006, partial [Brassica napus]